MVTLKKLSMYKNIEGERVELRPFLLSDAADMYEYASDERVVKTLIFSPHKSIEETKKTLKDLFINQLGKYAIVEKCSNKVIGSIDLIPLSTKRATFGYALHYDYWKKGIMTETLGLILDLAFNKLNIEAVTGEHYTNNPASGRVMIKNGMLPIGVLTAGFEDSNGRLFDTIIYNMTLQNYLEFQGHKTELVKARHLIDGIDFQVISLLNERFYCSKEVSLIKNKNGTSVLQESRETTILNSVTSHSKAEFTPYIQNVYKQIFLQSRNFQQKLQEDANEKM